MRKARKDEHIEQYMKTEPVGNTLLSDVYIEPSSMPELDLSEVSTEVEFCGKRLAFPLMINAMTGGTEMTEGINQDLAMLADYFGLAMQTGSQQIALDEPDAEESFTVVRSVLGPDRVVIGNLSARASVESVQRALNMLDADCVGLHLNCAQELAMSEGDRSFRGIRNNLETLVRAFPGRILVKEVGFGISERVAHDLGRIGVSMIDCSGAGGTNFVEIEDLRNREFDLSEFYSWGVPTAKSLINVRRACPDATVISSGGIRNATDIIRSFVLGADLAAIGGELLRYLLIGGFDYAKEYLESLIRRTRGAMLILGCRNIEELRRVPYRLTGRLAELCGDDR